MKNPTPLSEGHFEAVQEDIVISGETYRITKVTNFDELFERMVSENTESGNNEDNIPYWTEIWPASIGLSEFIAENQELVQKKKVIELGCGLGLPGIVAARMGAAITFSDLQPDALYFACLNAEANGVNDAAYKIENWKRTSIENEYEVLIASDVSYERTAFPFLIKAFRNLLIPKGIVLLSEPGRQYARSFFSLLSNNGFRCTHHIKREVVRNEIVTNVNILILMKVN
ncbi:MAG: methyltransferase [Bacteroidia bacterium]|nr:methyltransferase [Bacteroidia bacterium]